MIIVSPHTTYTDMHFVLVNRVTLLVQGGSNYDVIDVS